jgi:hypothetical protein
MTIPNSGRFSYALDTVQTVQTYLRNNFDTNGNGVLDKSEAAAAKDFFSGWNQHYRQQYALYTWQPEVRNFLNTLNQYASITSVLSDHFDQLAGVDGQAGLSSRDIADMAARSRLEGANQFSHVDLLMPG